MKKTTSSKFLAALALLGLALNASAEEPTTKPTATVTIAKPATETKPVETPKQAPQVKPSTPKPVTTPKAPLVAKSPNTHIVRKGETLTGIAHRNRVSVEKLALWNHLVDPDKLSIGQSIEIPTASAVPRTAKAPKAATPGAALVKPAPVKPTPAADPEEIRVTLSSK